MLKKRHNLDPPKEDQYKDLLVFGYSSKLFRDDEKAHEIDRGKHLIPWMGDESLMIDRYDGRGHLDDVRMFTADTMFDILTEEEKAREKELDEERYMDLYIDVEQKLLMEEEEMKRAREAEVKYGAVSFQYEEEKEEEAQQEPDHKLDDSEELEPFVPHEGMNLPPDMERPRTLKHHKIIEKTAEFISQRNLQVEILIKTREQNNPQFNFLNFGDILYPYYKHLLTEMKLGRYSFEPEKMEQVNETKEEHVEIQISSQEFLKSVEEKLPPRLVRDTCYDKIVNNLRKLIPVQAPPPPVPSNSSSHVVPPPHVSAGSCLSSQNPEPKTPSLNVATDLHRPIIVPPPPDKKFLIDKMAIYVVRNGPDFEKVVKNNDDPRFDFIEEGHIWHNYYKMRRAVLEQEVRGKITPTAPRPSENKKTELKSISFSIKTKDVAEKIVKQNILGDEAKDKESEKEQDDQQSNNWTTDSGQPIVQNVESLYKDIVADRKRSHSPEKLNSFKKSRSRSPESGTKPKSPDSVMKHQLPLFGPKPRSLCGSLTRSPVYGPDLPPKEYLERLNSRTVEHQQSWISNSEADTFKHCNVNEQSSNASLINNRDAKHLSREEWEKSRSGSKESRRRNKSRSRLRSKSRSQKRVRLSSRRRERSRSRKRDSRSQKRCRSRGRGRSRSQDKKKSRERVRSPFHKKSRSKQSSPLPKMPKSPKRCRSMKSHEPSTLRNSLSRSKSRESLRKKKSKKTKHHKRHHKHHHHQHKKDEQNDKMVILDLTNEDVVDLTKD